MKSLVLLLVSSIIVSFAHAQNRKQHEKEYSDISKWMGTTVSKIMKESSDGVIVSNFHKIHIANGDNNWIIRVNCIRKERDVYDAAGKHRGKHSYYEPNPDGFIIRISRKHLDNIPNGKPKSLKRRKRDDKVTELTGWVTSPGHPKLVCMIWGLEGSKFDDKKKAMIDLIIMDLESSIANKKMPNKISGSDDK